MVIGIDVGTGGARAVAVDERGSVLGEASAALTSDVRRGAMHEQDPNDWWRAVCAVCREAAYGRAAPTGICVTSTSGTLVLAGADGRAVRPAILYDDGRAGANASFSLAKAMWVRKCEPATWEAARRVLHPADWLAGKLTGDFTTADHSNVLKLGYDAATGTWSETTLREIGRERLPLVLRSGTRIGSVCRAAAEETGVAAGTPVFAGATDGMAALIASGAHRPGDANTTLGTTLVWKALSASHPREEHGIYCHLHPSGLWAPGAAANTGPGVLDRSANDEMAEPYLESAAPGYFLSGNGERFPFFHSSAVTFFEGTACAGARLRAAQLAALAFTERWGYELLSACGVEASGDVFSTGGAAASAVFGRLRACVLGRRVVVARHPSSAFGAAILAAGGACFAGDTAGAIRAMAAPAAAFEPEAHGGRCFEETYRRFREACARRGYGA